MGNHTRRGYAADGEWPVHDVELRAFGIGAHAVTNIEFAAFVAATGHRSTAERLGSSFVFCGMPVDDLPPDRVVATPWWREVVGADWSHPEGTSSGIDDRSDHPVVHVSWHDAVAFCRWASGRLPTEAEWEYAARGGQLAAQLPWGDADMPADRRMMNVFEGEFPISSRRDDGLVGTRSVGSYEPNGFGLYDVVGNVWEWCADWFDPNAYRLGPRVDPTGPASGSRRVVRGGSFLCHESSCWRHRVDARSSNTPVTSAANIGFRVAVDGPPTDDLSRAAVVQVDAQQVAGRAR